MRTLLITVSSVAFMFAAANTIAYADDEAAAGAVGGAAVGAGVGFAVGGPVGAAVGAGVGGTVGAGTADRRDRVIVREPSARERTCITDAYGNRSCTEIRR